MKIVINKSENYKTLCSVRSGECFIPNNFKDTVFLKTNTITWGVECCKCVNLSTGALVEFNNDIIVKVVNSEVVIDENV